MYLPRLSNQEIGCYHSKSPTAQAVADHSTVIRSKHDQGQVEDIRHELTELKTKQDVLRQTLCQVGEQLVVLAQSSGNPASMSG
jgi:hypothetical protein